MTCRFIAIVAAALAFGSTSCVSAKRPALQPTPAMESSSLWERPSDLARLDLFYGPWGPDLAPSPSGTYRLVEIKHTGVNPGMTVIDSDDREWSVKQIPAGGLDKEGPIEVVLSRLLSAVGYHQPPVYYLPSFMLKDDWGTHTEGGGRFRLKDKSLKELSAWSWQENPFIGTESYQGLLVLMMLFNSTDLKNSNNSLYQHRNGDLVEHWYVVRDLGAALGDTNRLAPIKGDPHVFERHPFVLGITNGFVNFAYKGWYQNLVRDRITRDDVRWATTLLSQLNDRQWHDAFRAGGYEPAEASRFIKSLRAKLEQGQSLPPARATE